MNTISEVIAKHKVINNVESQFNSPVSIFDTIKNKSEGWREITKEKLNQLPPNDLAELLMTHKHNYCVATIFKHYENITPQVLFALSYAYDWSNYLTTFIKHVEKQENRSSYINELINIYFENNVDDNNRYRNILDNTCSLLLNSFDDAICKTLLKYGLLGQFFQDYFDGYGVHDFDKILGIIIDNLNIHYENQTDVYSDYKLPDFIYTKSDIKKVMHKLKNDDHKYKFALRKACTVENMSQLIDINNAVPDHITFYKMCKKIYDSKSGNLYHNDVVKTHIIYVESGFDEKTKVETLLASPKDFNKDFFIGAINSSLSPILLRMFKTDDFFNKLDKTLLGKIFNDLSYYLRNNNEDQLLVALLNARGDDLYDLPCFEWGNKMDCYVFLQGYLARGKFDPIVEFINRSSDGALNAARILDEMLSLDFSLVNKIKLDNITKTEYTWH